MATLADRITDLAAAVRNKLNSMTTAINGKEAAISAGTTAQYWRGDKSWQTLNKSAVGLANVDNTADSAKPVSTAQQMALNAKLDSTAYIKGISGYCAGKPLDGETVLAGIAPYALTLSGANSSAKAGVVATASTVFTINKNGTQIGTITFAASGDTGTISITSTSVAAGDLITIVGPATADTSLSNIAFLLRA